MENIQYSVRLDMSDNMSKEVTYTGRHERTQTFFDDIAEGLRVNNVGIEFLKAIMKDHPDQVYHGVNERPDSYIIVRGKLANYCIPLEPLLQAFANPFIPRMSGLPTVEVHPLGKWVNHNASACIQPNNDHSDIPGTDSIGILVLSLLSDCDLFVDSGQEPFRRALMRTYGMIQSPISNHLHSYFNELYGASLDCARGEISIKGTHGFTWYLGGMNNPEVKSFSLSSSVRGGPRREHTADTYNCMGQCDDLDYLLPTLVGAPRMFLSEECDYDMSKSKQIMTSVAEYFAPLRRMIESGERDLTGDWSDDE